MQFKDVTVGDRINYVPVICVAEHEPLTNAVVEMVEPAGSIFNQPMVVCEGTKNGWMPLRECTPGED